MLHLQFLKIVQIELLIVMVSAVLTNSKIDLESDVTISRGLLYPVATLCANTKTICNKPPMKDCCKKRKRNVLSNINKNVQAFKRKHIDGVTTTYTPFFIRRTETTTGVTIFKYPMPTDHLEPSVTEESLITESMETKRGRFRNFFFPKISSTTSEAYDSYSSSFTYVTGKTPTNNSLELVTDSNFTSKTLEKKTSNKAGNVKNYILKEAAKAIYSAKKNKAGNVSQKRFTLETGFPSDKLDLGLCSYELKDLTTQPISETSTLSLTNFDSESHNQTKNPVTTINFLRKVFSFKKLTVEKLDHSTQTNITNMTWNEGATVDAGGNGLYSTNEFPQSSTETTLVTDVQVTKTFQPYTKIQVKDLFNFRQRPNSTKKPNSFTSNLTVLRNITNKPLTDSTIVDDIGERSRSLKSLPVKSRNKTTIKSKSEEELQSEATGLSACDYECCNYFNYDEKLSVEESCSNYFSEETFPTKVDVTKASFNEVDGFKFRKSLINLKNVFTKNKKENISNHIGAQGIEQFYPPSTDCFYNESKTQTSPTFISGFTLYPEYIVGKNSLSFPNGKQQKSTLKNESHLKTVTTSTSPSTDLQSNLLTNKIKGKIIKTTQESYSKFEQNISDSTKKDFLNLKRILHLKNKSLPKTTSNIIYNDIKEDISLKFYPLSTKDYESQILPTPRANESTIYASHKEFYGLEKTENLGFASKDKMTTNKKVLFKNVFGFMNKGPRSSKDFSKPLFKEAQTFDNPDVDQDEFETNPVSYDYNKTAEVEELTTHSSFGRTFRFKFKKPSTPSKLLLTANLGDSAELLRGSFSLLASTVPTDFNSTEEDNGFFSEYDLSDNAITIEGRTSKANVKIKNIFGFQKPVTSNNTKLSDSFDPGGSSSMNWKTQVLREQTNNLNFQKNLQKINNFTSDQNDSGIEQGNFSNLENSKHFTKPVGWWLFWNQPKDSGDKPLYSKHNQKAKLISKGRSLLDNVPSGTEISTQLASTSEKLTSISGNRLYKETTRFYFKNNRSKGDDNSNQRKTHRFSFNKIKPRKLLTQKPDTELESLNTSITNYPSAYKNKQMSNNKVSINISKSVVTKIEYNKTQPLNESNKNLHSPITVLGYNKTKQIYKPFEKVQNVSQYRMKGAVKEFDAKNFSYFIQNLTHNSNNSQHNVSEGTSVPNLNRTEETSLRQAVISSNNITSTNDSSFSIMAYVLKPFESLISVFKGKSTQNMTKVGDVNALDFHNGSIPSHLHPQNSSLIILALNDTNSTSREVHDSKVGLFDVLGGWFHCIVESYAEPRPHDIHFFLFTRNNNDTPEELFITAETVSAEENTTDTPTPVWENESSSQSSKKKRQINDEDNFEPLNFATSELESKWFNILEDTKILVHGYIQDFQTDIIVNMKDAYLKRGAFNVIVVDWSVVGDNTCYPSVAEHGLRSVGKLLSRLLDQLVAGGVSLAKVHVVGFSLGAHVAGVAGTEVRGLVSRITGLDPALPYVPMDPDISLDAGDAMFVDIVHSAAGYLGQPGPMGHVDFYPNGGSQQPGCDLASLGACSHRRSALYFIESINSRTGFKATQCDSWHDFQAERCNNSSTLFMGEPCPSNASGKYFLHTGHKEPFALLAEEHSKVKKSLLLDIFYELV